MPRKLDLPAIEAGYRRGDTLRAIGSMHGIGHAYVHKIARQHGWTRDLQPAIRAAANAKIDRVAAQDQSQPRTFLTEEDTGKLVESQAEMQSRVVLLARQDVRRVREILRGLIAEFSQTRHLSLAKRATTLQRLADALTRLIVLEYQVSGIPMGTGVPESPTPGGRTSEADIRAWQALRERIRQSANGEGRADPLPS